MSASHWSAYRARWARLGPPLRPHADVVPAVAAQLERHRGPTLLLGVTPELASIAPDVTAVDRSEAMIAGVWPGDGPARRAVRADWLDLPFAPASFAAAVGDGSLSAVPWPDAHRRIGDGLARVLAPGGRAVFRVFRRPDRGESVGAVQDDALRGRIGSFHAYKWRLAMAVVAERGHPNLAVRDLLAAFESSCPDRAELAARAGWDPRDIEMIDAYRDSDEVYSFASSDELLAAASDALVPAGFFASGSYELAERCPLFVLDRRA